jgi:hypothetical protein
MVLEGAAAGAYICAEAITGSKEKHSPKMAIRMYRIVVCLISEITSVRNYIRNHGKVIFNKEMRHKKFAAIRI